MEPRFQRIAVYVVIIAVLIGIGFLIYRFVQGPDSTNVKTLVITDEGVFNTENLKVSNDEVIKVKNEDNKNHTVKKSPSNETFAEVDARSTSRELTLPDDSETNLYLADDENETTMITVGSPVADEEGSNDEEKEPTDTPEPVEEPGDTAGASDNGNLPNTGPEGLYLFPVFTLAGVALLKLSKKLYK